jgi:hypothetical protein
MILESHPFCNEKVALKCGGLSLGWQFSKLVRKDMDVNDDERLSFITLS